MPELFTEQVEKKSQAISVVYANKSLTYEELDKKTNCLAHKIRSTFRDKHKKDFEPNTKIGLCVERGMDVVIGMLGILKAGGAYVPLDPSYPEERLKFILEDTKCEILLSQESVIKKIIFFPEIIEKIICLDSDWGCIVKESSDKLNIINKATDLAYIIYTSGSTGEPKGVCIPHLAIHNLLIDSNKFTLSSTDTIAQIANFSFDATTFEVWGALLNGAKLVILDQNTILDSNKLEREIAKNRINVAFITTALFNVLVRDIPVLFKHFRMILFGGERVNVNRVHELLREDVKNLKLLHVYGPTECTTFSTSCLLSKKHEDSKVIPIGEPLINYFLYVLDANKNLVPIGVPGELYIGGDGLAHGYLNRPQLTAERFIKNPFKENSILYKTGDLVRWLASGEIEFLGRTDFQVKVRGFRIEPEEIEKVLLDNKNIKECIVIPWSDTNQQTQLVAYWQPKNDSVILSQDDLKSYLSEILPKYMIPTVFIKITYFELTPVGKIDRKKLPPPSLENIDTGKEYVAPRNKVEVKIDEIWRKVLGIDKQISINDSFFDIGGNSILTVQMLSLIKHEFETDIGISQIFLSPTIKALAANIVKTEKISINNVDIAIKDALLEVDLLMHKTANPENVFLTGVTGFLGVYLLETLINLTNAKIFCLVRGENDEEIKTKFLKNLERYNLEFLAENPRIVLLNGDLEKDKLGLSDNILEELTNSLDHIYHTGAFVHHMLDYQSLRLANLSSTMELLKISSVGRIKTFNYISTMSTAMQHSANGEIVELNIGDIPPSENGYVLSKWVSEKTLISAATGGAKINIFRPGNITGDSINGFCRPEMNHALLLLKGCIQMGVAPDWKRSIEMTPVNILSDAIIRLSLIDHGGYEVYNLYNPTQLPWQGYIEKINTEGFKIDIIPANIWKEKYLKNIDITNALFPLKELYLQQQKQNVTDVKPLLESNASKTQEILENMKIFYPQNYDYLIHIYIEYLCKIGFLTK